MGIVPFARGLRIPRSYGTAGRIITQSILHDRKLTRISGLNDNLGIISYQNDMHKILNGIVVNRVVAIFVEDILAINFLRLDASRNDNTLPKSTVICRRSRRLSGSRLGGPGNHGLHEFFLIVKRGLFVRRVPNEMENFIVRDGKINFILRLRLYAGLGNLNEVRRDPILKVSIILGEDGHIQIVKLRVFTHHSFCSSRRTRITNLKTDLNQGALSGRDSGEVVDFRLIESLIAGHSHNQQHCGNAI